MRSSPSSSRRWAPRSSGNTTLRSSAHRKLRQLLQKQREWPTNGNPRTTGGKETSMLQNVFPRNAGKRTSGSNRSSRDPRLAWTRLHVAARLLLPLLLLLLILLSAGCAAPMPAAPQISACRVPLSNLEPTPQPPLNDSTTANLLKENDAVRAALESANGDKKRVKSFVEERCKGDTK